MTEEEFKQQLQHLSIWKQGDQRAPHKPLLLLYALSKYQGKKQKLVPYEEVKPKLVSLLVEFGPKRRSYHPEQPFTRLTTDRIWTLSKEVDEKNPKNKELLDAEVSGGFTDEVLRLFDRNPRLVRDSAELLLQQHFPDTLHDDILAAVGLDLEVEIKRRRDPQFRENILRAYEHRCAVCGFSVRLGHQLVGIEAAHIKWHQSGGPDTETNGVALCSLHHKLFDRGVYTINPDRIVIVSEEAHGNQGFEDWLMKFHGNEIQHPVHPDYVPQPNFTHWHVKEVFKGDGRYIY